MREFNYKYESAKILTSKMVHLLTEIHEYKGRQELLLEFNKDRAADLTEISILQNAAVMSRLEKNGISESRMKELLLKEAFPENAGEEGILAYRDTISIIYNNYEKIPVNPASILRIHHKLYAYIPEAHGGAFRDSGNTKDEMEALCSSFLETWEDEDTDKLLLIPMFMMDILYIHPFVKGSGVISRLLASLLLCKAGYQCAKYLSIDDLIERTKDTYSAILKSGTSLWRAGISAYADFCEYFLGLVRDAFAQFEDHLRMPGEKPLLKPDRIRLFIDEHTGPVTKKEIMQQFPDIAKITVERTLTDLVKKSYLTKVGGGPTTAYLRKEIREQE